MTEKEKKQACSKCGWEKSYWQSSTKNVKSLIKELKAKGEEQIG